MFLDVNLQGAGDLAAKAMFDLGRVELDARLSRPEGRFNAGAVIADGRDDAQPRDDYSVHVVSFSVAGACLGKGARLRKACRQAAP